MYIYERKKKFKRYIIILSCGFIFVFIYKWWHADNPFVPSTIALEVATFFNLLVSLAIWDLLFEKYLEKKSEKELKKVLIPSFIAYLLVILLITSGIVYIVSYSYQLIAGLDTTNFAEHFFRSEFPGIIQFYPTMALIAFAFFFTTSWRQGMDREQHLREENLKYRYKNLKAQVNPHFLFNSLNTLSEIIYTDTKRADNYIQKLSGIYRYILDNEETDLIALSKEIDFVNRYFELQKERDGVKIHLEIDFQQPDKFRIIPISLQILIENALKHNSASESLPLNIHIGNSNDEYIVVSNNIQKKTILGDSHKTGLANLKERVKLIMKKEMKVETSNNYFTVKLPVKKI